MLSRSPVRLPDADAEAPMASAMAAGPASISEHATILGNELDAAGTTCATRRQQRLDLFSDAPGTPGTDPMCLDKTSMGWLAALVAGTEPDTQVVGLAYMLAGGSDGSNTDPYAAGPEAGDGVDYFPGPRHGHYARGYRPDRLLHRSALGGALDHVGGYPV